MKALKRALLAGLVLFFVPALVQAAEVRVMISGAFRPAFTRLAAEWERKTGHKVVALAGPSMGATPAAVPNRLKRGEPADLVIVARSALDQLVQEGHVLRGSETDLARSLIGMAVKTDAPAPDISNLEAFKGALLAARSIAYSDSASGVYIETEMYRALGLPQLAAKSRKIEATPVGEIVAAGEAEIGFQQISELMAVPGVKVLGPIPQAVQRPTVFSAGIAAKAREPAAARALLAELAAPANHATIRSTGVEPASTEAKR